MSEPFDPFARHRQEKSEEPEKKPRRSGTPPVLLDWLRNRWPATTICARDIYRCAPCPIRGDRKITLELAEALTGQGWLAPLETHRYDRKAWQIVGKAAQNAQPSQLSRLSRLSQGSL
jgi:hypothetical protein